MSHKVPIVLAASPLDSESKAVVMVVEAAFEKNTVPVCHCLQISHDPHMQLPHIFHT